mgnify:CR=1 FL=1
MGILGRFGGNRCFVFLEGLVFDPRGRHNLNVFDPGGRHRYHKLLTLVIDAGVFDLRGRLQLKLLG